MRNVSLDFSTAFIDRVRAHFNLFENCLVSIIEMRISLEMHRVERHTQHLDRWAKPLFLAYARGHERHGSHVACLLPALIHAHPSEATLLQLPTAFVLEHVENFLLTFEGVSRSGAVIVCDVEPIRSHLRLLDLQRSEFGHGPIRRCHEQHDEHAHFCEPSLRVWVACIHLRQTADRPGAER